MRHRMMLFINEHICSISQNMRKHCCCHTAVFMSMNAKRHILAASLNTCASGASNNRYGIFPLLCHYSSLTYTVRWCIASMLQQISCELLYLDVGYIQNLSENMILPIGTLDSFSNGEKDWVYCAAAGTDNVLRI